MQSGEASSKVTEKRPNLPLLPKNLPTFVVGIALKDTYDDLVTAQQMICNKRSPQDISNSITPSNSIKMFDSEQGDKLDQILSEPESKIKEENEIIKKKCDSLVSEFNELELKIEDAISKEVINYNETEAPPDIATEKIAENYKEVDQPEIIFNAKNYPGRYEHSKFLKRKCKTYKNVKPKYNKFKCKVPKHSFNNNLDKYYDKAKQNSSNSGLIQQRLRNISTVVSRTRVLKKVLAKENLLDEPGMLSISNYFNLNKNGNESLSAYPPMPRNNSFVSDSSGNTLTRRPSTVSSRNEDTFSINTIKSSPFIKVSAEDLVPFKTNVINVAVAVAYDYESKAITKNEFMTGNANLMYSENLTSAETLTMDVAELTSGVLEIGKTKAVEKEIRMKRNRHEISDATLMDRKSSFDLSSDDDTYDMARTSSDFNERNNSTLTLKANLGKAIESVKKQFEEIEMSKLKKTTILQTVIDLGCYPEIISPSTSSAGVMKTDENDAKNETESYHVIAKNMGDHSNGSKINANILKKQFNERDVLPATENGNVPKQAQIKATDNNLQQQKCAIESKLYPSDLPEMWDRLVLVLDVAFKRLEESVTEKIIREMKKSIATLELHVPKPELEVDLEKGDTTVIESKASSKVISAQEFKKESDECLQCDLVKNKVIDQIMLKLSTQGPRIMEPERSVKSLQKFKPKLIRDYFEVLKPPTVVGPGVVVDKGDTVTISTVAEDFGRFHRLRMLFCGPLRFIRENLFVITSVPTFFIVLLFVYGLLMVTIKPW